VGYNFQIQRRRPHLRLTAGSQALTSFRVKVNGNNVVKELAAEKVGIDAGELLARINETAKDVQNYTTEMKAASEEDRLVIQLQIYSLTRCACIY